MHGNREATYTSSNYQREETYQLFSSSSGWMEGKHVPKTRKVVETPYDVGDEAMVDVLKAIKTNFAAKKKRN